MENVLLGDGDGAALALEGKLRLELIARNDFGQGTNGRLLILQRQHFNAQPLALVLDDTPDNRFIGCR